MTATTKTTPMMQQWHTCKEYAPDALLLFRMGDFYEAFYEDAAIIAKELELTLTKRQEIPMAGVPVHTCEGYIDKLVSKGYRIAVAEQTEDPKQAKGLVSRAVTRVVTPGTVINSSLLSDKTNNFFVAISQASSTFGLALIDLTTGEFKVIEFDKELDLINEVHRLRPTECLTNNRVRNKHIQLFRDMTQQLGCLLNSEEDWRFDNQVTQGFLINHFKVHNLDGFGLRGMTAGVNAAGALLYYLKETLCLTIDHVRELSTYSTSDYMTIDKTSLRNLELTESLRDGGRKNTLLEVLDHTHTPMGARMMRHWIKQPLLDVESIEKRQDAIQTLLQNRTEHEHLLPLLEHVRDLERLMMKISSGYASPRDIVTLRFSLLPLPLLQSHLSDFRDAELLADAAKDITPLPELTDLIGRALVDEPPARVSDGQFIREGYHEELDSIRSISQNSKDWLAQYQTTLRDQLNIRTLKVGYNRLSGYYIEVSKGQSNLMPDSFQRRQTLVNAERYISPELKEYETKVLTAEERITAIENELFAEIREYVSNYAEQVRRIARAIALLDCISSLAEAAHQFHYVRPVVDDSQVLRISEGRHPVVEALSMGEKFIPNDTYLDDENHRCIIITGPNMAGKSTFIRQVALITIMAQMGSFIPAKDAHIGIVDKVFTRIGASDDLSRGQSTFMVEMTETANILNHATPRSLVILDEIGRGTSTYDGISIAWSVAEYLLTQSDKLSKTLFATHYWELTKMEEKVPGAVNYNVAVHESGDDIVFLRKIVRGGTDKSYGIHVARLAGLPPVVLDRAKEILAHLEENANQKSAFEPSKPKRKPVKIKSETNKMQMTFFGDL